MTEFDKRWLWLSRHNWNLELDTNVECTQSLVYAHGGGFMIASEGYDTLAEALDSIWAEIQDAQNVLTENAGL